MLVNEGHDNTLNLPYVDQKMPDGTIERRYLASLRTPDNHKMMALPSLEATGITPFTRDQIKGLLFEQRRPDVPILDQNGQGACVAYAHTTAAMLLRASTNAPYVALSPNWLYTEINGGFDGGANAGDAINTLSTLGIATAATVPGRPIRPKGVSTAAVTEAARFKLGGYVKLASIEEVWTAIYMRKPVTLDVAAGARYNTDSTGTIAYLGRGTNHEQCAFGGLRLGADGRIQFLDINSWNTTWGQNGTGWLTEDHITASQMLYAPWWMAEDPQDPNMPPVLKP